jgi:hypothetical protein
LEKGVLIFCVLPKVDENLVVISRFSSFFGISQNFFAVEYLFNLGELLFANLDADYCYYWYVTAGNNFYPSNFFFVTFGVFGLVYSIFILLSV